MELEEIDYLQNVGLSKGILKEGKTGIDFLSPLLKRFFNYFKIPFIDKCCDVTSEAGTPVGYDGTNLQYYDTFINDYVNISVGSTVTPLTLTTNSTSGPSTLIGDVLNIPNYATGGGGTLSRFGIEDNVGVQDRNIDLATKAFHISNGGTINIDSGDSTYTGEIGNLYLSPTQTALYNQNVSSGSSVIVLQNGIQLKSGDFTNTKNTNLYLSSDNVGNEVVFSKSGAGGSIKNINLPFTNSTTPSVGTSYIPLSVNGIPADSTGNITITTGGGSGVTPGLQDVITQNNLLSAGDNTIKGIYNNTFANNLKFEEFYSLNFTAGDITFSDLAVNLSLTPGNFSVYAQSSTTDIYSILKVVGQTINLETSSLGRINLNSNLYTNRPTGQGYILTDVSGNGHLTMEPASLSTVIPTLQQVITSSGLLSNNNIITVADGKDLFINLDQFGNNTFFFSSYLQGQARVPYFETHYRKYDNGISGVGYSTGFSMDGNLIILQSSKNTPDNTYPACALTFTNTNMYFSMSTATGSSSGNTNDVLTNIGGGAVGWMPPTTGGGGTAYELILTTNGTTGAATYNPLTDTLNVPNYSLGASPNTRFGIEDNTGVQNRLMNLGVFDYTILAGTDVIGDSSSNLNIAKDSGVQIQHTNTQGITNFVGAVVGYSSISSSNSGNTIRGEIKVTPSTITAKIGTNVERYLPLSVNNTFADVNGNITIAVGGNQTFTPQSVPFAGANGVLTEDVGGLGYDNTNLIVGHNNAGVYSGFIINGGRASLQASINGMLLNVGSGFVPGTYDATKKYTFQNRGNTYLQMFSNVNAGGTAAAGPWTHYTDSFTLFRISTLKTNVTAPVTVGVTKMVITDQDGQLSYTNIPAGGATPSLQQVTTVGNTTTTDIEITDFSKGVILKSPNGSRYRVNVNDSGVLTTTLIAV